MKKTLALSLAGVLLAVAVVVLGVAPWGARSDADPAFALAPGASRTVAASVEPLAPGARRGATSAGEDASSRADGDDTRQGASDALARRGPAFDPPLAAAASEGVFDFAAPKVVPAGGQRVWTFDPGTTFRELADRGVELTLAFPVDDPETGAVRPSPAEPWIVRVWGVAAGERPRALETLVFEGDAAHGAVTVDGAVLARHDQVFALRAAWRAEPARFVAAVSSPVYKVDDRSLACPRDAGQDCTVLAWWRLESDGSLGLRRLPLPPGESVFVQARYASLFTLE